MDLAREILRQTEAHPDAQGPAQIEVEGRSSEEIAYHVYLLAQAGLIEATSMSSCSGFDFRPRRLTWQGHEFLDAARDDTI